MKIIQGVTIVQKEADGDFILYDLAYDSPSDLFRLGTYFSDYKNTKSW